MNINLERKCKLLVNNHDAMRKTFRWDSEIMMLAGSSFFVGLNLEADTDRLKTCEEILKRKSGLFSSYRGNIKMPLLCKMVVAENPEQYFEDVDFIVQQMKALKWIETDYKVLAAMTLRDNLDMDDISNVIKKMVALYQGMKENHPWLTSGEDVPFAAILAVSGMDTKALMTEMENCYKELTKTFRDKNAVQSLSHILAIDPVDIQTKCQKVKAMFDILKENKHKYGTGSELTVLGTLSMLELSAEQAASEIMEADDYLKSQKGFGSFTMRDTVRRMYAALMVMDTHMPPASHSHESLVNSMLAIVIAMEVCMMIVMTSVIVTTTTN